MARWTHTRSGPAVWQETQRRMRALAPWATATHAEDTVRELRKMPILPLLALTVRSSDGARWAVTREASDLWQVAHQDGRHWKGDAEEVVRMMEGGNDGR